MTRARRASALVCIALLAGSVCTMADFRVDAWREDTQEITTPRHSYRIEVAGTLDTDNTTTLDVQTRSIAFQNMDSVVIENVGDTAVPWRLVHSREHDRRSHPWRC